MLLLSLLLASSAAGLALARSATFYNDRPLLDVNGEYVDAHDGSLVEHGGVYFLYGERYGTLTGSIFPTQWAPWPQLAVYTSPDLVTDGPRQSAGRGAGELHERDEVDADGPLVGGAAAVRPVGVPQGLDGGDERRRRELPGAD
jgi:hypothetical protein